MAMNNLKWIIRLVTFQTGKLYLFDFTFKGRWVNQIISNLILYRKIAFLRLQKKIKNYVLIHFFKVYLTRSVDNSHQKISNQSYNKLKRLEFFFNLRFRYKSIFHWHGQGTAESIFITFCKYIKENYCKKSFSNKYLYKVSLSFTVCFINTILSTIRHWSIVRQKACQCHVDNRRVRDTMEIAWTVFEGFF